MLPQGAGTGSLHRVSLFSPAGLADGLALKELRYAYWRFAPDRPATWVPHAPFSPRGFGFDDAAMLAPEHTRRTEKPGACGENATTVANGPSRRGGRSAPGDIGHVGGHRVRVGAVEQVRGHPASAGAAALDRLADAGLVEPAELVEVGAGHPVRLDRLERVTALAGLDEERLPLLLLAGDLLGAEAADAALGLAARGDHGSRHGNPEPQVEEDEAQAEGAPAAGDVGLPGRARAARERNEDHEEPDEDEGHEDDQDFHEGGTIPAAVAAFARRRPGYAALAAARRAR